MFIGGGQKVSAFFIDRGRPVEVKEGGKISVTLGLLTIICYINQLFLFVFTFFAICWFKNVNFPEICIKMYQIVALHTVFALNSRGFVRFGCNFTQFGTISVWYFYILLTNLWKCVEIIQILRLSEYFVFSMKTGGFTLMRKLYFLKALLEVGQ